jgi:hypothetical protein
LGARVIDLGKRTALCLLLVAAGCGRVRLGRNDVTPDGGEECGRAHCPAGMVCCNASCGICTPPDGFCPAIACGTPCLSNFDCTDTEGSYCEFGLGNCAGGPPEPGECAVRPESCLPSEAPVCGCNGITYESTCHANAAGVSVLHEDACSVTPHCLAQNIHSNGTCMEPAGAFWDGERCQDLAGCMFGGRDDGCDGLDCAFLYPDRLTCERDHAGCASCARQDAEGEDLCDTTLGWAWDGESDCARIEGCTCSGSDCGARLYRDDESCTVAHTHCNAGGDCIYDRDCAGGYCHYEAGECVGGVGDGIGECRPYPTEGACGPGSGEVCGCDGLTYRCEERAALAGVSLIHLGACDASTACSAMEAFSDGGGCGSSFGYAYHGVSCDEVEGCSCSGADCGRLFPDLASCQSAFEGCERARNGECGEGLPRCRLDEYCDMPAEAATCGVSPGEPSGTCLPRPVECHLLYAPVCGCDGSSYQNECVAHSLGIDDMESPEATCEEVATFGGP